MKILIFYQSLYVKKAFVKRLSFLDSKLVGHLVIIFTLLWEEQGNVFPLP